MFLYFLDVGTVNALLLYRISTTNESMKISNFKSSIVRSLVSKLIEAVLRSSKELTHHLVRIYMNNTARNLCAYCALFSKKNRTRYKIKAPECNMSLCSVEDHSGPGTEQDCFDLTHHTSEILRAVQKNI